MWMWRDARIRLDSAPAGSVLAETRMDVEEQLWPVST